jgi:hypothetical protein
MNGVVKTYHLRGRKSHLSRNELKQLTTETAESVRTSVVADL